MTITEDNVDGYETKIDGTDIINIFNKEEFNDDKDKIEKNEKYNAVKTSDGIGTSVFILM